MRTTTPTQSPSRAGSKASAAAACWLLFGAACADRPVRTATPEFDTPAVTSPLAAEEPTDRTVEALPGPSDRTRPPKAYGEFPATIRVGSKPLTRNGTGLCEWGILGIDLYTAALWVQTPTTDPARVLADDGVAVIDLNFVRALSRSQLQDAFRASVEVNAGERKERFRAPLEALTSCLQDVAIGESLTFTAHADAGLVVQQDDVVLTRIPDAEFARLFVELYVGDNPPTRALRLGLLGR